MSELMNVLRETKDSVQQRFRSLGDVIHAHVERTGILHHLNIGKDPDMVFLDAQMASALIEKVYTRFDKDCDGTISMTELKTAFETFDADGNGNISEAEFTSKWISEFSGTEEQALLVFGRIDKDHSKQITVEELAMLYARLDADGDGTITKSEFMTKWRELLS